MYFYIHINTGYQSHWSCFLRLEPAVVLQPSVVLVVVHPEQSLLPAPHRPHGKKWTSIGFMGRNWLVRSWRFDERKLLSCFSCFFHKCGSWDKPTILTTQNMGSCSKRHVCTYIYILTKVSRLLKVHIKQHFKLSSPKRDVEFQIVANGGLQRCSRYFNSFENFFESDFNSSTVSSTSWVAASLASADDNPLGTSPRLCQHREVVDPCGSLTFSAFMQI